MSIFTFLSFLQQLPHLPLTNSLWKNLNEYSQLTLTKRLYQQLTICIPEFSHLDKLNVAYVCDTQLW